MASLNLNITEMTTISGSTLNISDNRSNIYMVIFLIISLFAPSVGCTIFLLLHFGRLHFRH